VAKITSILRPIFFGVARNVILFAMSAFQTEKNVTLPRENDDQGLGSSILSTDIPEKRRFDRGTHEKPAPGQGRPGDPQAQGRN